VGKVEAGDKVQKIVVQAIRSIKTGLLIAQISARLEGLRIETSYSR
jgi:hypothetical protein